MWIPGHFSFTLSYGLYVVGAAKSGGMFNGQIANTVFQVSADPPALAGSINRKNLTNEFIKSGKAFSVSVLSKSAPLDFIGHFGFKSGRDGDKFGSVLHKVGVTGAPVLLENCVSYLKAEVTGFFEVETHTVFVGKVVSTEVLSEGEPMTYACYHLVKWGAVPPGAPVRAAAEAKSGTEDKKHGSGARKYRCSVCGYIYDPGKGDPAGFSA